MDKKIVGILVISILAIVFIVSCGYSIFSQSDQTDDTLENSPSPEPTPTPSPSEEPTEPVSIPQPSVPEFTVEFVDYSYDKPPTYGVDPYTGESVITADGYHVDNRSMTFAVKNQPFTSYEDANGNYITLYYNYRFKGHYEDEWSYYPYDPDNDYSTSYSIPRNASQFDYTIITLGLSYGVGDVSAGGEIDFQVEALIGYEIRIPVYTPWGEGHYYEFKGESSGWSETLTLTCPYG